MIKHIKREIKVLEKYLKGLEKGKYVSFKARRNGKDIKVRFKLKPIDKFKKGQLYAYKELLFIIKDLPTNDYTTKEEQDKK